MNATEAKIQSCSSVEELEAIRKEVGGYRITAEKKERYLNAIAALYPRLIRTGRDGRPRFSSQPAVSRGLPPKNVTGKPRWRKITKYDGAGNLLLVGYERRSRASRKAGETRWLKTPKVLKAAEPSPVAATV